jgi:regulator of protease activity HflC (stomatin/prohibitin superfamily)
VSAAGRSLRAAVALVLAFSLSGCGTTSSTEVGVRTRLVWFFESRGAQQVYEPGGVYFFLPLINSWNTLPISQQNLLMNAAPNEGDRQEKDDITFKTKDGNNVYIDVNVMWRIDPKKAGYLISYVGQSALEIKERVVRPISRSVIRDIFNEITSEEYYQVTVKNTMAQKAKDALSKELVRYGVLVDMLQVQQHRFDVEYQNAINAQKQAEADVQTLVEQQKNMFVQKQSELEGKRSEWNKRLEDALGEAGRVKNDADGYYQTKTNLAKATIAVAQAEAEGVRKEAEALGKMGGDAYVKMQVAKQFAQKRILIVPGSNVSTMNVNEMVNYLLGRAPAPAAAPEVNPAQPPAPK